ncbi:MAG: DegT/DnrJ/EryC1/StrS family aminotransferase [Planctomycetes bacterium]|nr:DegT/DnrJ/EryC1/StrS family aminotransferase [Planctomycetota bacterium]
MKIPITKPYFGEEERRLLLQPLETGWVVQGPFVRQFEEKFCAFTGSPHAVATTSCTTALHLAMRLVDLRPGDEVIVPAFTWIATPNVVEYLGGRPVFVDIDLRTFNLDVRQVSSRITSRTVGILPVHLFGLCAEMDSIQETARRNSLWVVEDAACAVGARYRGKHAGTMGEIGAFSFHPRKSITTGEGGILTTGRKDFDALARTLRDHGASRSDLDRHSGRAGFLLADYEHLGYNYRMTDLQGALGCAQMDRLEWVLAQRSRLADGYRRSLEKLSWLETPAVPDDGVHGYQAYVCLFRPEEPSLANAERLHARRNDLMARLEARGVATRQGTHAPVLLDFYAGKYALRPEQFPNAYLADRLTLALPLYAQMTDEEQTAVVAELEAACGDARE